MLTSLHGFDEVESRADFRTVRVVFIKDHFSFFLVQFKTFPRVVEFNHQLDPIGPGWCARGIKGPGQAEELQDFA